ncbi:MAG: glycosyltransferase family 39 protein [Opitutaceae bacterium]
MITTPTSVANRRGHRLVVGVFAALLAFNVWGVSVGWKNVNLPGCEFRQAQTALSALFIQRDNDFSLAYPTPVLGKPWSVPMEFPLYQWTVVLLSNATGISLTPAARTVSAVCFYLTLPAFYLLLRRLGLTRMGRLIALGFVVTCPIYIFYTRSFMIETMALLAGAWYLAALIETLEKRSWQWLALCVVAGTVAGLVKVTTFILFLVPAFTWTLIWLWQSRPQSAERNWRPFFTTLAWLAAAHAVPFMAAKWWVVFSDSVKMENPSGVALTSSNLVGWNFGVGQRFSPEVWAAHWKIFFRELISPVSAILSVAGACLVARRWLFLSLASVALFMLVQVVFPVLYAWHDYYYVANAFTLMLAVAMIMLGLLEVKAIPRVVAIATIVVAYSCQILLWYRGHFEEQRFNGMGGDSLNVIIKTISAPDEALIVAGQDWNSMMPYFSQRRTLMLRDDVMRSAETLEAAIAKLQGTPVAMVILRDSARGNRQVVRLAARYLGIDERQALTWQGDQIFLHRDARTEVLNEIEGKGLNRYHSLEWAAEASTRDRPLAARVVQYATLAERHKKLFRNFSPAPHSFFSTVGPELWNEAGGQRFFAHPETKFWFTLPAGGHRFRTTIAMTESSYSGVSRTDASDGVVLVATFVEAGGGRHELERRDVNPRDNESDRGVLPIDWHFSLPAAGQLEIAVLSGPAGNSARDWVTLGELSIESDTPAK